MIAPPVNSKSAATIGDVISHGFDQTALLMDIFVFSVDIPTA